MNQNTRFRYWLCGQMADHALYYRGSMVRVIVYIRHNASEYYIFLSYGIYCISYCIFLIVCLFIVHMHVTVRTQEVLI
jgi:hypothetical protein